MKVSTEIDNNFGYEKITQLVDNIPLTSSAKYTMNIHDKNKWTIYKICYIEMMEALDHRNNDI
jgi:hypothetical protein